MRLIDFHLFWSLKRALLCYSVNYYYLSVCKLKHIMKLNTKAGKVFCRACKYGMKFNNNSCFCDYKKMIVCSAQVFGKYCDCFKSKRND